MHTVHGDLEWLDGGAGFGKDCEKTTFIERYKGQQFLESHDRKRPEGAGQIEEEYI